jgi:hypothetical protein
MRNESILECDVLFLPLFGSIPNGQSRAEGPPIHKGKILTKLFLKKADHGKRSVLLVLSIKNKESYPLLPGFHFEEQEYKKKGYCPNQYPF